MSDFVTFFYLFQAAILPMVKHLLSPEQEQIIKTMFRTAVTIFEEGEVFTVLTHLNETLNIDR